MKIRNFVAWSVLLLISLSPVAAWYFLRPATAGLSSYSDVTQSLGEIAALTGITMFALTFALSTRARFIEDAFGGLDKVYIAHGILGGTALMLILFHPILLVLKFVPQDFNLAAAYLLPSSHWSVNFGIIAMLGFIGLIYVTLYSKMKYNDWKFSHKFLGAVFAFAVLHMFLVRGDASRDNIFSGYYAFASAVSVLGMGSFLYTLLVIDAGRRDVMYRIESVNRKRDLCEVVMVPDRKQISYKSGQFVFLKFNSRSLSKEPHPFSIASKSGDPRIRVVIKELGDYTKTLTAGIKAGQHVAIEGPYGRFNRSSMKDQVWIAAGIGITPFIGMAQDLKDDMKHHVDLYYTVRTRDDFISTEYLKSVEEHTGRRFRLIPWVSSESGRLGIKDISDESKSLPEKEFYLCGPSEFKKTLIQGLVTAHVPRDSIYEEEFSFR